MYTRNGQLEAHIIIIKKRKYTRKYTGCPLGTARNLPRKMNNCPDAHPVQRHSWNWIHALWLQSQCSQPMHYIVFLMHLSAGKMLITMRELMQQSFPYLTNYSSKSMRFFHTSGRYLRQ